MMMLHCLFLVFSSMVVISFQDGITSTTNAVHALEHSNVTLTCNYTDSNIRAGSLHWYRQYPRSSPEYLIHILGINTKGEKNGFTVIHEEKNNLVYLERSSAEVTDSALYYCALQPTVTGNPYTLYKNLTSPETP
ncbi:hypothetical protein AAFF_G00333830 [Aldrovandia affinis]|uniref:Ig-like domain-containing protein n=1 Tax=Aldrovandia affinis TaxID=143900 RepID=A0AAD7VZB9_9TELE|nr:hypothetical protein AAFF_G00333830 [Aldrovandia affinis]